jgi:serine/threonine-protein kinase
MKPEEKYTILRKIADGGMAEIFLAQLEGPQGFKKLVVLKQIRPLISSDPLLRNALVDEAHVAMSLGSGNIVQVLDLFEFQGRYSLVLELVDGWSLDHLLRRSASAEWPLPRELSLYIISEVCRALHYAHSMLRDGQPLHIVHRDISPQNILISEQGEVKLADFGIAKARTRTQTTEQGIVKGKISFMSPEQAGASPLDWRSDIFSLGTVLYRMVTGKLPFDAPSELETLVRIKACEFPRPSDACPDLEPALATLVLRAMQKDPEQRFQSAEEMMFAAEDTMRQLFHPFSQTELKRWIHELGARDGVPPISRLPTSDGSGPAIEVGSDSLLPPTLPLQVGTGYVLPPTLPGRKIHVPPPPQPKERMNPWVWRLGIPAVLSLIAFGYGLYYGSTRLHSKSPLVPAQPSAGAGPPAQPSDALSASKEPMEAFAENESSQDASAVSSGARSLLSESPPLPQPAPDAGPQPAAEASQGPALATPGAPAFDAPSAPELSEAPARAAEAPPELAESPSPVSTSAEMPAASASPPSPEGAPPEAAEAQGAEKGEAALPPEAAVASSETLSAEPEQPSAPPEPPGPPDAQEQKSRVAEAAAPASPTVMAAAPSHLETLPAEPLAASAATAPPEPSPQEDDGRVSVTVTSRPEGALVKIKERELGRTPVPLRFAPGQSYELTFVKEGYAPTMRRFMVENVRGQKISASLKKRGKKASSKLK